ncbi:MAG: 4Fe-4S dicluster domain-containing protein [Oscillospiraceae bacterium]|nr:4Fe-4S dicluster domain-containing protein [Oscillospiraceae bacterium]
MNCGRCVAVCPVWVAASDGLQYHVNKDTCLSCGACAKSCHLGIGYVKEKKQRACCIAARPGQLYVSYMGDLLYLAI